MDRKRGNRKRARVAGVGLCALVLLSAVANAQQQQAPAPQASPFGAFTPWATMTYEQLRPYIAQLPCPLPGLPPQLAALVDCSVLKPISNTTQYQPVPPPANGALPASVDMRQQGLTGMVRDQGEVGSCSANAIASLIDTYTRRRGINAQAASALHIFAVYERSTQQGSTDDDIGNLTRIAGVTTETVWPYDPVKACRIALKDAVSGCDTAYHVQAQSGYVDPTIVAERQRADASPAYRIADIQTIAEGATRDNEIMKLLAQGESVYLAIDMATNWTSASGASGAAVLPPPQGYYGSHAVLAKGYRTMPTGVQFLIQNSWGTKWGQGGFAWIPEETFRSRLREAYRFKIELTTDPRGGGQVAAKVPQPAPTATTAPTQKPPQGCPPGSQQMFGACVPVATVPACAPGQQPTFANFCIPTAH